MPDILSSAGSGPAAHALVIGISHYRHLADGAEPTAKGQEIDIKQLTSAARSASEFAAWPRTLMTGKSKDLDFVLTFVFCAGDVERFATRCVKMIKRDALLDRRRHGQQRTAQVGELGWKVDGHESECLCDRLVMLGEPVGVSRTAP